MVLNIYLIIVDTIFGQIRTVVTFAIVDLIHHGDGYRHDLIASGFLVVFISSVFYHVSGASELIYLLKTYNRYVKTCVISHFTSEVNSVVRLQTWCFQVTIGA